MEYFNKMWKLVSENSFVGAFVSGIAILIVLELVKFIVNKYKAGKVYSTLKSGLADKKHKFLPTSYLAA